MVTERQSYEYILSHEELARQEVRGDVGLDNIPFFKMDFRRGTLDCYKGTAVAYHKGILCGQSENKEGLFEQAKSYYGSSNLAVFEVPNNTTGLEKSINEALGDF